MREIERDTKNEGSERKREIGGGGGGRLTERLKGRERGNEVRKRDAREERDRQRDWGERDERH